MNAGRQNPIENTSKSESKNRTLISIPKPDTPDARGLSDSLGQGWKSGFYFALMKYAENEDRKFGFGYPMHLSDIAHCSGVYFLLSKEDEVIYVGKSKYVAKRLVEHAVGMPRIEFSKAAWIPTDVSEITSIERVMIEKYQPVFNRIGMRSKWGTRRIETRSV